MNKRKNTGQIVMYAAIAVGALALIMIVAMVYQKHLQNDATRHSETEAMTGIIVNTTQEDESFTYDFSQVELQKDIYPEINELVKKYYEASRVGDYETINSIVDSEVEKTAENFPATSSYIESYNDFACYTLEGLVDNTYVVYVTFTEKLVNINTPAPSMDRLYVCRDAKDGAVYVYDGELSGEVATYLESADLYEDVTILKAQVNKAFAEACEKDANLAALRDQLINITVEPDETESETETETEEQTEATTEAATEAKTEGETQSKASN